MYKKYHTTRGSFLDARTIKEIAEELNEDDLKRISMS
jgi:hypothetical protein